MWRGYWRRAWGLTGYQGADGMRTWWAAAPGTGGHADVAHSDAAHGDAHGDSNGKTHGDTHTDTAHSDVPHVDSTGTGIATRMR